MPKINFVDNYYVYGSIFKFDEKVVGSKKIDGIMLDFSSATAFPEAGAEEQKEKKAQEIDLFGDF